ncbi:TBC1 domain family member 20-like isoform X1 [Acanthaster planci]|uniref:TBC1 domain family member 20 n=1 Tax=Acanthaster planci TaxID=133434 RepID=A0A8B7ZPL8_ACAPL|nr:TBC1 domain family member 20-like isoform X1 [Acanthaster planci]
MSMRRRRSHKSPSHDHSRTSTPSPARSGSVASLSSGSPSVQALSCPPQGTESERRVKLATIHKALIADPVDVAMLRKLAISKGGLLTDDVRRKAWPKLLNVNLFDVPYKKGVNIENHRDYHQVVLDVNRSLKRFPKGMRDDHREALQGQLVDVIVRVLIKNEQLHYYQGYHDICVTFLLVVGKEAAFALMDKLSTHHLRDFMDSTMDRTRHMLNYLLPIIKKANVELHDFMERSEVGTVFALAWLITWYGHVLNDFRSVVRLYDFFLACHPLMPVYLAAAIVLYRQEEVMACECDMAFVHSLLSKIPANLPMEHLVSQAGDLFVQYPPEEMAKEARLQYKLSTSMSKHPDFELETLCQRPDKVLQHITSKSNGAASSQATAESQQRSRSSTVVKLAVWAISAGIGAAALAVLNTAGEYW